VASGEDPAELERGGLIAAAWKVLARSGFEGFKVQLVLRDAGLSARTFYRHFDGKDELLLSLLEDEMRRSGVLLTAAVAAVDDPPAQVEAWIRGVIGVVANPRLAPRARLFSSQQAATRRFPLEVAASTRHLLQPLEAAITRGRDSGVFPGARPDSDAKMIYRLTGAVMTDTLDDPDPPPVDAVVAETVGFALRALTTRA
jgi:AcrR family transcriptional regulator